MSDATAPAARTRPETPLLSVEGLAKHFDMSEGIVDRLLGERRRVRAVDGVDLDVYEGETVAVVGESGCGKSTLARTILNLHTPMAGTVRYRGEDITALSKGEMRSYRRNIQMIFQDPLASLNPRQTVGDIVTTPMEVHGIGDDDADRMDRARDLLERVGLERGHIDRYPHQFSGGQQQRVGVARALTVDPNLLIADEPVSSLDVSVQAHILHLLEELQADFDLSLLVITHDLSVVRHIADRVAVMYLGEIVENAPTDELFGDPRHPYTEALLSGVPRIDPATRTDRIQLTGTVPSPEDPPSGCRFHTRCPAVIPPDDWTGDQETFRWAFEFRNRVLKDDFDPDTVRSRLVSEGRSSTVGDVADHFVEQLFDGSKEKLPAAAETAIRDAATALAEDDPERAAAVVREAFPSPCERDTPLTAAVADDHIVACHRFDPDAPGNLDDWP